MNDLREVIEDVKIRNDIHDIISEYIQLKPSGANYKGLCPFHNEKTPSFLVSSSKQIYKCFGCGESGDVISFIMKVENLEFMDAVKFLANKCGIEINHHIDEETKERFEKIKRYQNMHTDAARFFFNNLTKTNNEGLKYLMNRGLDERTINKFGLGYSLDSWNSLLNHLLSKGYKPEEIKEAGLVGVSQKTNNFYDKFRNRVMFPIFDYRGNIIGFGGRVLDDSLPKYLNSEDTIIFNKKFNLFGLNIARKNLTIDKTMILVEGYMDLISLSQFGVQNVVATLGTALTSIQAQLLSKFVDNVIISYDSDQAGINATLRAIDILEQEGLKSKVLDLANYKDPDEFIRNLGLNSFMNKVENAVDGTQFKIDILYSNYNHEKQGETIKFVKEALKILKTIKSPIELDFYEKYLSKITNIEIDIIRSEMSLNSYNMGSSKKKFKNKTQEKPVIIKREANVENGTFYVELNLLKMIMMNINARNIVPLKIPLEYIKDDRNRQLYSLILSSGNKTVDVKDLDSDTFELEYLRKLDSIDFKNINFNDTAEVNKIINNLLKEYTNNKIYELEKKMKALEEAIKNTNSDTSDMELEMMKIALEIIEEKKKIKSL